MYYDFYIDIFILENILLDYLVLLLTGGVLRKRMNFLRILLASFAGAAGGCILMLTPIRSMPAIFILGYLLTALLMAVLSFGISSKRMLAKEVICLCGIAFLMGGIFQALASQFSLSVPALAFCSAGFLTLLLRGYQSARFRAQNYYDVILGLGGRTVCVRGLRDTGNHLKDPVTGKPVSILSYDAAGGLFDKDVKMYYIPYHSIGKSSGLLPGVILDYMSIRREKDLERLDKPMIAVSKEPVNRDGKYQMILHPAVLND